MLLVPKPCVFIIWEQVCPEPLGRSSQVLAHSGEAAGGVSGGGGSLSAILWVVWMHFPGGRSTRAGPGHVCGVGLPSGCTQVLGPTAVRCPKYRLKARETELPSPEPHHWARSGCACRNPEEGFEIEIS